MPKHAFDHYMSLHRIYKGNMKEGIRNISKDLGFDFEFLLLDLLALLRKDDNLGRFAIKLSVDQLSEYIGRKQLSKIPEEDIETTKNNLLALYSMARGSKFDIIMLCKEVSPHIDRRIALAFYMISK